MPKRGSLKSAGKRQESATFLQRSFFDVAVQFFVCCSAASGTNAVRTAEKRMLQCSFCSAAFRKLQCNFRFACGMLQGWGLEGWSLVGRGEKTPTPKISALLRKRPVLLRANFVLTKDRKRPYYGHFRGKIHREGSCSKAAGGP